MVIQTPEAGAHVKNAPLKLQRVSQGFGGTREHGQFQGEQRKKKLGNTGTLKQFCGSREQTLSTL